MRWIGTAAVVIMLSACQQPPVTPLVVQEIPPIGTVEETIHTPELFNTRWDDRSVFRSGLTAEHQDSLNGLPGAPVYHLDLVIDPGLTRVSGTQQVQFTNTEQVPLAEVIFRLFPNLLGGQTQIGRVLVDRSPVQPETSLGGSVLSIPLPMALEPGDQVVIEIGFEVSIPTESERNYGILAFSRGVLTLAHIYPMLAVFDDEGWNYEIPAESGDVVFAEASFFLVRVKAPAGLVIATTGQTISQEETGTSQSLTIAAGPARDFYLAASYDFTLESMLFGQVTINTYLPASYVETNSLVFDTISRALEDFGRTYGSYPYTEFDLVSTPTFALGIEYPGIVAIADRLFDPDAETPGLPPFTYLRSTIIHEVAHQWFYNLVGNDQLDDPWLDESLAQFTTWQHYRRVYGQAEADGFYFSLADRWRSVDNSNIPVGMPVGAYSGIEYSAIVYGRGALFIDALRTEMGTERFDLFMKEYVATHAWEIASPDSLKQLAEQSCTCSLSSLFNEWVFP